MAARRARGSWDWIRGCSVHSAVESPQADLLRCRRAALTLLLSALPLHRAEAVIPGLAPAFVAILPQVLLLLVLGMALLFSPRTWWRLLRSCLQRPLRSLLTLTVVGLLGVGVWQIARVLNTRESVNELPRDVHGFAFGDPDAARHASRGPGPLTSIEIESIDDTSGDSIWHSDENQQGRPVLHAVGTDALMLSADRQSLICIDLEEARVRWRRSGEILAGPFRPQRLAEDSVQAETTLIVTRDACVSIDLGKGEELWRAQLDASSSASSSASSIAETGDLHSPPVVATVVDDRVLIARSESLTCLSLSSRPPGRELWRTALPAERVVGLAGDELERFWLLTPRALSMGRISDGRIDARLPLDGAGTARCLAISEGLVYTLSCDDEFPTARLSCVDGALAASGRPAATRWDATIERPLDDELTLARFGLVTTTGGAIEVRHRVSGKLIERLETPAANACPAIAGSVSCFALLVDGRLERRSLGIGRAEWSLACSKDAPTSSAALLAVRDRLLVLTGEEAFVVQESMHSGGSPWSHWRCGSRRCGTSDGAELPLAVTTRWSLPLLPASERPTIDPERAELIGTGSGWLALTSSAGKTRALATSTDGARLVEHTFEGALSGIARLGERIFIALGDEKSGHVHSVVLEPTEQSLRTLWSVPVGALAGSAALAAQGELLIVALESELRALSVEDGSTRWSTASAPDARAPLLLADRVVVPCEAGSGIAALSLLNGRELWRRQLPDRHWSTLSGDANALIAASHSATSAAAAADATRGAPELPTPATIHRVDPQTGTSLWTTTFARPVVEPLVVGDEELIVSTSNGERVLLSHDGKEALRIGTADESATRAIAPIAALGAVIVGESSSLRCIDTLSGDAIWQVDTETELRCIALEGNRVAVLTNRELIELGPPGDRP